jgi:hypothetical protein
VVIQFHFVQKIGYHTVATPKKIDFALFLAFYTTRPYHSVVDLWWLCNQFYNRYCISGPDGITGGDVASVTIRFIG